MDTQLQTKLNSLRKLWKEANDLISNAEINFINDAEHLHKGACQSWIEKAKTYFDHIFYNSRYNDDFLSCINQAQEGQWNEEFDYIKALNLAMGHIDGLGNMLKAGCIKDQFTGINNDISKNCFVAMSFDESRDDHYTLAIKPAIENNGYTPKRVDKEFHNEKIDTKIISDIEISKFLIVDYTHHKNGAYYEAGYAKGLGLNVIQCCDVCDFDNLHFDIQSINTIKYTNITDLRTQLESYIKEIIGSYIPPRNEQQIDIDEDIPF